MKTRACCAVVLGAVLAASACRKDPHAGRFAVVFDWSAASAPASADYPELWVRGRVERRNGEARSAWTVVSEVAAVPYRFDGDTELRFTAVPNQAHPVLVVVLEITEQPDRSAPALYFGESQPFAILPEQQVVVPVRMQPRRTPHAPASTEPSGALYIVEALDGDGVVASHRVTLSFVAAEASQVIVANDLSFSLNRQETNLASLQRDGERYLWENWDLDKDLCPAPPCADGVRRVYLKLLNEAGYSSPSLSAQVRLDSTAPRPSYSVSTPALVRADAAVLLQVSLDEPLQDNVVSEALARSDDGASMSLGAASVSDDRLILSWRHVALAGEDGPYHLVVSGLCDRVGNCQQEPVELDLEGRSLSPFVVDATPPEILALTTDAAVYSAQPGHDRVTVTLQVGEVPKRLEVWIDEQRVSDTCTADSADAALFVCSHRVVDEGNAPSGTRVVYATVWDAAGNSAAGNRQTRYDFDPPALLSPAETRVTLLRQPFFAPAVEPGRTWFSPLDPFSAQPVRATLFAYADEPLAGAPQLRVRGPGGASLPFVLQRVDGALAVFTYAFSTGEHYVDGGYNLEIRWQDGLGNARAQLLPVLLQLVASESQARLDLSQTVHQRLPWGAEESAGEPRFSLLGRVASTGSATHVLAFGAATATVGHEIGSAEIDPATGQFAIEQLAGGDRPRVYALVVDRSGARSPLQAITRGAWVASLGQKEPGRLSPNPHRFELLADLPKTLFAPSNDGVAEAGGATLARIDGLSADTQGEAGWTRVHGGESLTGPAPRFYHAMAYDSARGRALLFGGDVVDGDFNAETWEWDGRRWIHLQPATQPKPRYGHSMVYDASRGVVLMYGGQSPAGNNRETWEWDGRDWLLRHPAHDPCWRVHASMAYDSRRQRVLLFGGYSDPSGACGAGGDQGRNDETWQWDGEDWTRVDVGGGPSPRRNASMAFDSKHGQLVVFGGLHLDNFSFDSETWTWNGQRWSLASRAGPESRWAASLVEDRSAGALLLFGGYASTTTSHSGNFGDTWSWDGSAWSLLAGPGPDARHGQTAVYDSTRDAVLLFGGHLGRDSAPPSLRSDELWQHDSDGWRQRLPLSSPSPRLDAAMAFDGVRGETLLYGGSTSASTCDRSTWLWDGESWWPQATAISPTACHKVSLAYDSSRGKTVLFGGESISAGFTQAVYETWEWDGAAWSQASDLGRPSALRDSALVYDATRDRSVLFAGSVSCGQTETWAWGRQSRFCFPGDSACWNRLSRPSLPSTCALFALAYDADRDRAVLVGGNGPSQSCVDDTWEFGPWGTPSCPNADDLCWKKVSPAQRPAARHNHTLVYDPGRQRTLMFGGGLCSNALLYLAETWEWDGASWTQVHSATEPSRRQRQAMSYDPLRAKVVMFGGNASNGRDAETWEWDRDRVRPAHIFRADLAAAALDPQAQINELRVRLLAGAHSQRSGVEVDGAELLIWDLDHWQAQQSHGAAVDNPADLVWSSSDATELRRLLYRQIFNVAVAPLGRNGSGLAEVDTDYVELRLSYTLP